MRHASKEAAANVMAANVIHATETRRHWLEPVREPMTARDYVAAAVITICGLGLVYFAWAVTP